MEHSAGRDGFMGLRACPKVPEGNMSRSHGRMQPSRGGGIGCCFVCSEKTKLRGSRLCPGGWGCQPRDSLGMHDQMGNQGVSRRTVGEAGPQFVLWVGW